MNSDYESLMGLITARRSVRRFDDRPVERGDIERLVDAARWAPSNHNRQGWKFVVFSDAAELTALAGKVRQSLTARLADCPGIPQNRADELIEHATDFAAAPRVVLVMHKRASLAAGELFAGNTLASGEALSAAMATENMLLAAASMELAACVFTAPLLGRDVWEQIDDLPLGFDPTCLVAIGHPSGPVPEPPRKKRVEQIIEYRLGH